MHGVIQPRHSLVQGRTEGWQAKLVGVVLDYRFFLGIVILPTLIVAAYYYLMASDQYQSSADFVVRRAESSANASGVGQIFGLNIGTSSTATEALIVQEYLLSHDAVAKLRQEDHLVQRFRPIGADWFSRLWSSDPSPERLLKYYRRHVEIEQNESSGISHLTVQTFAPDDSRVLAEKLLRMGEQQINAINEQTYLDQVTAARRELDNAAAQLSMIQRRLTAFRRGHEDIDPTGTGRAQLDMVTTLTASLVQARAGLAAMGQAVSRSSPQYVALQRQIRALEAQVAGQSSQMAGGGRSVANRLGGYEQLVIERDEAAKLHAAAAGQYAQAQAEAKRKQLYLIRIVEPNQPVRSQFPERGKIVLTVLASLFFVYAIGWLLWAGVKEHSI